jgi:hypothetical protein
VVRRGALVGDLKFVGSKLKFPATGPFPTSGLGVFRDYPRVLSLFHLLIFVQSLYLGVTVDVEEIIEDFGVANFSLFKIGLRCAIHRVTMSWCPNSHVTPGE